jgi:zinc transporter
LPKITSIRRNCLALKRHMSPQHEALERIMREAPDWFEDDDRREIAESIERLKRYLDDIDISKESALVLQDELRARSLASNEHATYMLTIVAGIFLPLGFLTGLMGINVGGMPGVENADAFWIVVALCLGVMALQLFLFWRWKWL